jgi:hypothetical protein
VEENHEWFFDQFELGAGREFTADEWLNLHHTAGDD